MERRTISGKEFWSRKDIGLRTCVPSLVLADAGVCYHLQWTAGGDGCTEGVFQNEDWQFEEIQNF